MKIRFKKKDEEIEVPCIASLNLLGHAQLEEFDLGSVCGGHGECGKDRVQIALEDRRYFSPPTKAEVGHLSEEERAQGWRLACQCYPSPETEQGSLVLNVKQ